MGKLGESEWVGSNTTNYKPRYYFLHTIQVIDKSSNTVVKLSFIQIIHLHQLCKYSRTTGSASTKNRNCISDSDQTS